MTVQQTAEKVSNHRASNDEMNFRFGHLAVPIGGVLVGLTLFEPRSGNFAYVAGGDRLDSLLFSDVTAVALAGVVAVLTAFFVARAGLAVGLVVTGVLLISIPMLAPAILGLYFNGLGAGLVLGGLLVLCRTGPLAWLQSALAVGVLLGSIDMVSTIPRRYADYSAVADDLGSTTGWLLLAGTGCLTLFLFFSDIRADVLDRRDLTFGLGLPVVALAVYWLYVRAVSGESDPGPVWPATVARAVVTVAVLLGSLWLSRGSRTAGLIAVTALAVAAVDAQPTFVTDGRWIFVGVVTAVIGVVVGRRWPAPVVGICILAVVAAVGTVDGSLATLTFPAVAAFALASSVPTTGAVAAPALLAPLLLVVPFTADVGWTANGNLDGWTAIGPSHEELVIADVAGITTIALCAVVAWVQVRRRTVTPTDGETNGR